MKLTRRTLLKASLLFGGALAAGGLTRGVRTASFTSEQGCLPTPDRLDEFAQNIVSGGVPPDGIPPIDDPRYVPAAEANEALGDLLGNDSVVFGMDYQGSVKAYPQIILVWHEIVNERIKGEKVSISYCPLTGSVIGFKGHSGDLDTAFGTSGKLLNSNLVMYDRQTGVESLWPQILGRAVTGPHKGERLAEFPLVWTTWNRWREQHPQTLVLTAETGFIRTYGRDPYGSYQREGTYYDRGGPFFPVMARSDRFPAKKVVIGVRWNGCPLAIPKEEFRAQRVANTSLGGELILILYEEAVDTIHVFSRKVEGVTLEFRLEDGAIVDAPTRSEWTPLGQAIRGPLRGTKLSLINCFDVMWFAWYAFYPNTEVFMPEI